MSRHQCHFACEILLLCLLPVCAAAQLYGSYGHPDETNVVTLATAPNTGIITFKIFAERNGTRLTRQALVKLVNLADQMATWQTTRDNSEGIFTDVPYGDYDAEISAIGYLSSHQPVKVVSTHNVLEFDIVLHRDPAAVNLDVDDSILPPKARKETRHAVSALKSGRLDDAQKYLDAAYKTSPSDANVTFLLGYLYFQKGDYTRATGYLTTSTTVNPHSAQALTLLGRSSLEERNYPVARSALELAVLADQENWLPHELLGDAYLHEKNFDKARNEAQIAIAKGKAAAAPAQLVLGEALVNLGQTKDGVAALQTFLETSPRHPVAGRVRSLIADIEEHGSPSSDGTAPSKTLAGVDPLLAISDPKLSVKAWQPPSVDDVKVAVDPAIPCPSDHVIAESGKRVQELVDDLARFAAIEDLFHQTLDEYGNPGRNQTRKFDYVASISELEPGYLDVTEDRAATKLSLSDYPGKIASTGFTTLAFVFHPHVRDNFDMVCEGLGNWRGQDSWLVHFQQRSDRPNRMHTYKVGNSFHPVPLKGRAWITSDKFQIVRIEAEMVKPMPEIQLLSEHQVVEYGPVPFPKKNTTLWLPKSAEIYFDFRKHRYYRRHSFDHYMLFSVDADEKRKEPVPDKPNGGS